MTTKKYIVYRKEGFEKKVGETRTLQDAQAKVYDTLKYETTIVTYRIVCITEEDICEITNKKKGE